MTDNVTSAICDPPLGSLNVAVNLCGEPASTDNIAETGDAARITAGVELRVVEQPQRIRLKQRIRPNRMFELLHHNESRPASIVLSNNRQTYCRYIEVAAQYRASGGQKILLSTGFRVHAWTTIIKILLLEEDCFVDELAELFPEKARLVTATLSQTL
jgi:hypothetical protein